MGGPVCLDRIFPTAADVFADARRCVRVICYLNSRPYRYVRLQYRWSALPLSYCGIFELIAVEPRSRQYFSIIFPLCFYYFPSVFPGFFRFQCVIFYVFSASWISRIRFSVLPCAFRISVLEFFVAGISF